jgi:hypothetical protein
MAIHHLPLLFDGGDSVAQLSTLARFFAIYHNQGSKFLKGSSEAFLGGLFGKQ